uniref:(northern house mosquito) hypothetical protein n=1 Tax=Culex pipiens TaxID=7175 RepID=A0A8D8FJ54_CULPI
MTRQSQDRRDQGQDQRLSLTGENLRQVLGHALLSAIRSEQPQHAQNLDAVRLEVLSSAGDIRRHHGGPHGGHSSEDLWHLRPFELGAPLFEQNRLDRLQQRFGQNGDLGFNILLRNRFCHVRLKLVTVLLVRLLELFCVEPALVVLLAVHPQRLSDAHFVLLPHVTERLLDHSDSFDKVTQRWTGLHDLAERVDPFVYEHVKRDVFFLLT